MIWLDNLQCHDFSNKLKHLKLFFFPEMINTPRCFLVRVLKLRHDDVLIPLMQLSYSPSAFISTLPHLKHKASGNLHMYWCSLTLVYKVIHNTKKTKQTITYFPIKTVMSLKEFLPFFWKVSEPGVTENNDQIHFSFPTLLTYFLSLPIDV